MTIIARHDGIFSHRTRWALEALRLPGCCNRTMRSPSRLSPTWTHPSTTCCLRRRTACRARAMVLLWMQGGPSHIDLFDPKPELNRLDG